MKYSFSLCLLLSAFAVTGQKVSQLPPAAPLSGNELLSTVQSGATVRTTARDIAKLGGDSSRFATTYAVDTAKRNLRIEIAAGATDSVARLRVADSVAQLKALLAGKSDTGHSHIIGIGDVNGLTPALGAKLSYGDTGAMLSAYIKQQQALDSFAAINDRIGTGGGGSSSGLPIVSSRAALSVLSAAPGSIAYLDTFGRGGFWRRVPSGMNAQIAKDPYQIRYVAGTISGSAWERVFDGQNWDMRWAGIYPGMSGVNGPLQALVNLVNKGATIHYPAGFDSLKLHARINIDTSLNWQGPGPYASLLTYEKGFDLSYPHVGYWSTEPMLVFRASGCELNDQGFHSPRHDAYSGGSFAVTVQTPNYAGVEQDTIHTFTAKGNLFVGGSESIVAFGSPDWPVHTKTFPPRVVNLFRNEMRDVWYQGFSIFNVEEANVHHNVISIDSGATPVTFICGMRLIGCKRTTIDNNSVTYKRPWSRPGVSGAVQAFRVAAAGLGQIIHPTDVSITNNRVDGFPIFVYVESNKGILDITGNRVTQDTNNTIGTAAIYVNGDVVDGLPNENIFIHDNPLISGYTKLYEGYGGIRYLGIKRNEFKGNGTAGPSGSPFNRLADHVFNPSEDSLTRVEIEDNTYDLRVPPEYGTVAFYNARPSMSFYIKDNKFPRVPSPAGSGSIIVQGTGGLVYTDDGAPTVVGNVIRHGSNRHLGDPNSYSTVSPAAGSTTQVQFNDGGVTAGDAKLVFDKSGAGKLTVGSAVYTGVGQTTPASISTGATQGDAANPWVNPKVGTYSDGTHSAGITQIPGAMVLSATFSNDVMVGNAVDGLTLGIGPDGARFRAGSSARVGAGGDAEQIRITSGSAGASVIINNSNAGGYAGTQYERSGAVKTFMGAGPDEVFRVNAIGIPIQFMQSGSPLLSVTPGGGVGVNTPSPNASLHVNGGSIIGSTPEHASNSDAVTAGLPVQYIYYRTGHGLDVVR